MRSKVRRRFLFLNAKGAVKNKLLSLQQLAAAERNAAALNLLSAFYTNYTITKQKTNEYKLNDRDDSLAALQTDIDEGRVWRVVREEEDCRLVDDARSRL